MIFEDEKQQAEYEKYVKLPLGKEIEELLLPISKDFDFIVGAMVFCKTVEQRQKLINEIKTKNITNYGEICHLFNEINKGNI